MTKFAYTSVGSTNNLLHTVITPNGNSSTVGYNSSGQATSLQNAVGETTTYGYTGSYTGSSGSTTITGWDGSTTVVNFSYGDDELADHRLGDPTGRHLELRLRRHDLWVKRFHRSQRQDHELPIRPIRQPHPED